MFFKLLIVVGILRPGVGVVLVGPGGLLVAPGRLVGLRVRLVVGLRVCRRRVVIRIRRRNRIGGCRTLFFLRISYSVIKIKL